MFPEFVVFGIRIPVYGLISFVGFIVAAFVGLRLIPERNVAKRDFLYVSAFAVFGVIAGANFLYALTRISEIAEAFGTFDEYNSFLEFTEHLYSVCGGMVFYGGLYGGLLSGFLFAKHKKYCLNSLTDIFAVLIPLFHTFGRIGCFFAGCCYGVKWEGGISGRIITVGVKESAKRFPVQLMEAVLLFCLFLVIFRLFKRKKAEGRLIFIYLMVYAALRFVLEFFRGDEIRGHFLMLSTSQWISLLTLLWVGIYLLTAKNKK